MVNYTASEDVRKNYKKTNYRCQSKFFDGWQPTKLRENEVPMINYIIASDDDRKKYVKTRIQQQQQK